MEFQYDSGFKLNKLSFHVEKNSIYALIGNNGSGKTTILIAPTVEEDISFGARNLKLEENEIKERVEWALDAVKLAKYKNYSPFDLSWGQKKRAALAGLLVMKPKLLILDEPFANLDFKSIYNHLEILEMLRNEIDLTILFTTHNLFFVEHWANKMLFINDGKAIFEGDPQEGLNNSNVRAVLSSYEEILTLINKYKKS
ncbi:MAG: ABC transporter ATP-binding protein [Candidatus Lokiarchaeota archaeon]